MLVTTGQIIKVESNSNYLFFKTAELPGVVYLTAKDGAKIELPAHPSEAESFIRAYQRVVNEDVGYRKSEVE